MNRNSRIGIRVSSYEKAKLQQIADIFCSGNLSRALRLVLEKTLNPDTVLLEEKQVGGTLPSYIDFISKKEVLKEWTEITS